MDEQLIRKFTGGVAYKGHVTIVTIVGFQGLLLLLLLLHFQLIDSSFRACRRTLHSSLISFQRMQKGTERRKRSRGGPLVSRARCMVL